LSRDRQAARDFGLRAETVAALWLRLKFYQIIARNFRVPGGEIDIVARRGDVVAFVEVKARPRMEVAQEAIHAVKIARISRAARFWLARNRWAADLVLRGDAVFVAPGKPPLHVADAFTLDLFR
jgi:putative endonuclease